MEEKDKGGRPRKEVDFKILKKLCNLHCTGEECAAALDMDYDTLNARVKEAGFSGFSDYYKTNSSSGKISLRRMQWKAAEEGNITMLIWLGKNVLGQADKLETEENKNVKVTHIAPEKYESPEEWAKKNK